MFLQKFKRRISCLTGYVFSWQALPKTDVAGFGNALQHEALGGGPFRGGMFEDLFKWQINGEQLKSFNPCHMSPICLEFKFDSLVKSRIGERHCHFSEKGFRSRRR